MRRDRGNGPYDDDYPPRRRGGWIVASPFGIFGSSRRGGYRRGYGGYGPGYGAGFGRGGGGGSCLRDACLLETGCCLAEGLDGSCLLLTVLALPQLLLALVRPTQLRRGRLQAVLLQLIEIYQREISARRRRPVCRYTPSCSAYAAEAIRRRGAVTGVRLAMGRLFRCRPGSAGGADPVPQV